MGVPGGNARSRGAIVTPMTERKDILLYDIPPAIREALIGDARQQNISINDCALSILTADYKLKWEPSAKPFVEPSGSRNIAIRGGAKLHRKVDIERAQRGGTLRGVVLEHLAIHYGIEPEPIGRRASRAATT